MSQIHYVNDNSTYVEAVAFTSLSHHDLVLIVDVLKISFVTATFKAFEVGKQSLPKSCFNDVKSITRVSTFPCIFQEIDFWIKLSFIVLSKDDNETLVFVTWLMEQVWKG